MIEKDIETQEREDERERNKAFAKTDLKFRRNINRFMIAFLVATFLESFTAFISFRALEMSLSYAIIAVIIMSFFQSGKHHTNLKKWLSKYISFVLAVSYLLVLIYIK